MTLREEIIKLKREKNAAILAHYYTSPEVQSVADYVGDSYKLSKLAVDLPQQTLVLCGVEFMGESASVLNPTKKVLMPDVTADCPMAHMATMEDIRKIREQYEDVAVVCYINSTAELKRHSDVCVTSANAVKIVQALPNRYIYFIPDKNLAHFVAGQVPEKEFIFHEGFCPIHEHMKTEEIRRLKDEHPKDPVLAHPECNAQVLDMADFIGSTSQIIAAVTEGQFHEKNLREGQVPNQLHEAQEFIICTENGINYELTTKNPGKKFYFPETEPVCTDMKKITLEKILHVMQENANEIRVSDELREDVRKPLERMLELAR